MDDRSADGTREFLSEQPDVMVTESASRFGEVISAGKRHPMPNMKAEIIWRNLLMWKFGLGRWSVSLDVDEFLALPPKSSLDDLLSKVTNGRRAIRGVMLDVYPRSITELMEPKGFDPHGEWFFDGQAHLELREDGTTRPIYSGARARLMMKYGLTKLDLRTRIRNLYREPYFPKFNYNSKTVLHFWGEGDLFLHDHGTTATASNEILLPLKHYKFNSDVFRKTEVAIAEKQHFSGSAEYSALERLLQKMKERNGSFMYRYSKSANNFENFVQTRNFIVP